MRPRSYGDGAKFTKAYEWALGRLTHDDDKRKGVDEGIRQDVIRIRCDAYFVDGAVADGEGEQQRPCRGREALMPELKRCEIKIKTLTS
jgi:hypothetical protein